MNKIIFIFTRYINKVDFERYGIERYIKKKINVEILYLNKLIKRNYVIKEFKAKKVKIKKINNFNELELYIKRNTKNCFYDLKLAYNFENKKIFQLLSKYNINYLIYQPSPVFLKTEKNKHKFNIRLKYLLRRISRLKINNLIKNILNRIFYLFSPGFWKIKNAAYANVTGNSAYLYIKKNKLIDNKTKLISGQHRDYDFFLRENMKSKKVRKIKKKALFIDSGGTFHPDVVERGITNLNAKKYYGSVNTFLEKVQNNFGYKIEISCSPRIYVHNIKKFFPKFKVKIGKTIEQTRNSSLIICHDTTAINFAIMYNKPIIFITNNSLNNDIYPHLEEINIRAKLLDKKCINIDTASITNISQYLKINKKAYRNFLNNFIKSNKLKKFQAELVIKQLKIDRVWT